MYREGYLLRLLGWVDFDLVFSSLCLVLPRLMGTRQNWLSETMNHHRSKSTQQTFRADAPLCIANWLLWHFLVHSTVILSETHCWREQRTLILQYLVGVEAESGPWSFLAPLEDKGDAAAGALSALSVLRDIRICCFVFLFQSKQICTHPNESLYRLGQEQKNRKGITNSKSNKTTTTKLKFFIHHMCVKHWKGAWKPCANKVTHCELA